MGMPTDQDIQEIITAWRDAQDDVDAEREKVKTAQEEIVRQKQVINDARKQLPKLEGIEQDAEKKKNELLDEIAEEMGLYIEATELSVVQGGKVRFEAKWANPRPNNIGLLWDTGGCQLVDNTKVRDETIVVDTSSVGPGEYNISVSPEPV